MIGKTISHYKIIEKLGEGGMGVVYKAEDTKLKRHVALKFLPSQLTTDPDTVARFEREAQAAASLNHPNIITIYEIGEFDDQVFICMEYVDGQTIREYMAGNPMPLDRALDIATQIAEGLGKAHNAHIVHRDLKPDNILIDKDGRVKIVDFGLAKLRGVTQLTKEASTVGTAAYMSPEQTGGGDVDHRADIWALAAVIYEMIAGRPPFVAEHAAGVQYAIVHEHPAPITGLRTGIPVKLDEVLGKAMAKDPGERYQHVSDFAVDLRSLKKGKSQPSAVAASGSSGSGGKMAAVVLGALAIVVIVVVFAWNQFSGKDKVKRNSIAVLPLENLSGDPEQDYFADGLTEALITDLAQIGSIKVISRTSVMKYKDTEKSVPEIAEELGVTTIVEGSVLWSGDRVRINAQLIDAASDEHLWAEDYERDLSDIIALQNEVARAITDEIRVTLTPEEEERLSLEVSVDPEAYRLYLHGRFEWNKRSRDGLEKSVTYMKQAIEIDPGYALAYAGLADTYIVMADWGHIPPTEGYPKAKELALNALEIDPTLAEAITSLAYVTYNYDWDWEEAERIFTQALALKPNYATAHQWYAEYLQNMGRFDESLTEILRAQKLDPLSTIIRLMRGYIFFDRGNYALALVALDEVIEMDPYFVAAHLGKGRILLAQQEYKAAFAAFEKGYQLAGWSEDDLQFVRDAFEDSGIDGFLRARVTLGERESKKRYVSRMDLYYEIAESYARLGETDRALESLEAYFDEHGSRLVILNVNPYFSYLHREPRFIELLDKIGFERSEQSEQEERPAHDH